MNQCLSYLYSVPSACTNPYMYGPNAYQTDYCSHYNSTYNDIYCDTNTAENYYYFMGVPDEGAKLEDGKADPRAGRIATLVEIISFGPADIDSNAFSHATSRLNLNTTIDIPNANTLNARGLFTYSRSNSGNFQRWDMSKVTDMRAMFENAPSFNQPIGNWDTSNVTMMGYMFEDAPSFDQSLELWDVSNVSSYSRMFNSSGLSKANWDKMVENNAGWASKDKSSLGIPSSY